MTTAALSKPKAGRPKGSKTNPPPITKAILSRCPVCYSTERSGYTRVKTTPRDGTDQNGLPFNYVSRKRTKCRNCGKARIDFVHEYVI